MPKDWFGVLVILAAVQLRFIQYLLQFRQRGVTRFRGVATEACRLAGNCDAFLARTGTEVGLELEIISGGEEARLALDSCTPLLETAADNWRLSRMAVVDRTVLRLGVYELLAAVAPPAVVIDEAIELARTFSGEEAARFVNGVLDGVRRTLARRADPADRSDAAESAQ